MQRRVAITGMGAISGFGISVATLWQGVEEMRCAIRPLENLSPHGLSMRVASEIAGYVPQDHFGSSQLSLLDRVSQISVVSAREAAAQAGLSKDDFVRAGRRAGVVYGGTPGHLTFDDGYRALYANKAQRLHPFTLARSMPAGPAAAISIDLGIGGRCFGVTSACATGTHSIGQGYEAIRSGRLDLCLSGGSDASVVFGYVKAWEGLRLLAPDTARPFSRDRTGLALGEAAGTLVLEEWAHAKARGATILAEVMGFGATGDAADMIAPKAESAAAAMREAIEDAELQAEDIGYVNAHGTGTVLNDKTEVAALQQVFPQGVPPTSSLKSQLGHCLNAAGSIEAITTVMALRAQLMPATINHRLPDPACAIDCLANATRRARFTHAVSNSFAFGGLNAVLVLGAAG